MRQLDYNAGGSQPSVDTPSHKDSMHSTRPVQWRIVILRSGLAEW